MAPLRHAADRVRITLKGPTVAIPQTDINARLMGGAGRTIAWDAQNLMLSSDKGLNTLTVEAFKGQMSLGVKKITVNIQ